MSSGKILGAAMKTVACRLPNTWSSATCSDRNSEVDSPERNRDEAIMHMSQESGHHNQKSFLSYASLRSAHFPTFRQPDRRQRMGAWGRSCSREPNGTAARTRVGSGVPSAST
jgi:hypothetical protein